MRPDSPVSFRELSILEGRARRKRDEVDDDVRELDGVERFLRRRLERLRFFFFFARCRATCAS